MAAKAATAVAEIHLTDGTVITASEWTPDTAPAHPNEAHCLWIRATGAVGGSGEAVELSIPLSAVSYIAEVGQ